MNFFENIAQVNERGQETDNPVNSNWKNTLKDALPLQGATAIMLDRSVPATKLMKDELTLLGIQTFDVVTHPSDFLRAVSEKPYSIAFIDYNVDQKRNGHVLLEEIRVKGSINPNTILVMISGDRSGPTLMGCMEFEPDSILIKPFSAEELSKRVIRLYTRKKALSKVHSLMSSKNFDEAIRLADSLANDLPQYEKDLFKLKIKALFQAQRIADVEESLKSKAGFDSSAWMDILLSRISLDRGDQEEAESWLRKAMGSNPNHITAMEELAILLHETGRSEEALNILETAAFVAKPSASRLRKMVLFADKLGEHDKKKAFLIKLLERTNNTVLSQTQDFYQLAECYVSDHRPEEAFKVIAKLRSIVDANEGEVGESLMVIYGYLVSGDAERGRQEMDGMLRKMQSKGVTLSVGGQLMLIKLCAGLGLRKKAETVVAELKEKISDRAVLSAMDHLMTPKKKQQ